MNDSATEHPRHTSRGAATEPGERDDAGDSRRKRDLAIATAAIVCLGMAVIAGTYSDYGISWDEPTQASYGEKVLAYFTSDERVRYGSGHMEYIRFYGPAFEVASAFFYRDAPEQKYEIRHLMTALAGVGTLVALSFTGALFRSRWVALFAPLLLVMMPRFYGHSFVNSKDIPFAFALTCTVCAMCRLALTPSARWTVLYGIAAGLSAAVRPGGLPLLVGLFGVAFVWVAISKRAALRFAAHGLGALVIAWLLMIAAWPWAHEDPLLNPLRAMAAISSFPVTIDVLFEGRSFTSDALPRHYMLKFVGMTVPPFCLGLGVLGLLSAARHGAMRLQDRESLIIGVAGAWLISPFALLAVGQPNVYDGARHILFALPALALFGAYFAALSIDWAGARSARDAVAVSVGLAVACALPIASLIRLHPYQMTYFNAFAGGLAGANGRYETDYWLLSYKEAIEWLNERSAESEAPLRIAVAANDFSRECAAHFVESPNRISAVWTHQHPSALPEWFDYYVGTTRYEMDGLFADTPIVKEIGRDGAVFAVIRGQPL